MKLALFLVLIPFFAHAEDQPLSPWNCAAAIDGKPDLIGDAIEKSLAAKDIESAAEFASSCATFGSSIDVSLISPVANAFDEKLKNSLRGDEKAMLQRFLKKCVDKGENEGGSLGRAMAAHCSLKVYRGFYAAVKKWD